MYIDIGSLLSGEKNELDFSFSLPAEGFGDLGADIENLSDGGVEGKIRSIGGCLFLTASVTVSYDTVCGRCLVPLSKTFTAELERTVGGDDEDSIPIANAKVEPDEVLYEQVILTFPPKHICSEDCLGLCPDCGQDLNKGKCSCKKETDPRWSALLELLEDDGEEE